MHSTNNLNDGYFGSGKRLKTSIKRFGKENHKFEIIEFLKNRKELSKREKEIVNEKLIGDILCLNVANGGEGGFISKYGASKGGLSWQKNITKNEFSRRAKKANNTTKERHNVVLSFKNRKHNEETKQKIGLANSAHQKGEGNSQFGKMWIYNCDTLESVRIMKTEPIPEGWVKGRKIKNAKSRRSKISP
jgi:hypothetical protein